MSGDLRKLLKAAQDQGFIVKRTRKGHWQVRNAEGQIVAVIAGTPSDSHAWRNALSDMRKAGLIWPRRKR